MLKYMKKTKQSTALFFGFYTLVFAILCAGSFMWFHLAGKSFFWKSDGLFQHYNSLAYLGEYLRDIVKNIFVYKKIEIPMWDFSIGYGSDILTTLHYYVIGEPLNLLSIFFSKEKTESLYNILIVFRFYLAGISFLLYCIRMEKQKKFALIGAVCYVFCGYAMYAGVRHPYFITPMIYLPLMLIGIERVFKKEKPYLFIVTVFLAAISNFYFFYMLTVFMVIYAAIRFFYMQHQKWLMEFAMVLGRFVVYYLVGIMAACVIFYPVIMQMLSTDRAGADINVNLFYNLSYYIKMFTGVISVRAVGSWTHMGYIALIIPVIVCLIFKYKEKKELLTGLLVLTLVVLLPIGGHVLNGFSYISNRWIWAMSFLVSYLIADMLPEIFGMKKKQVLFLVGIICAYLAGYTILVLKGYEKDIMPAIFLAAYSAVILFGVGLSKRKMILSGKTIVLLWGGLLILVIGNIFSNARYIYTDYGRTYTNQFYESGKGQQLLGNVGQDLEVGEGEFYRYESNAYEQKNIYNSSMQTGRYGTSYYFSLSDENITSYLEENQVNIERDFKYMGLDGRTALSTIAGVKYFEIKEGNERYLPYGYEKVAYTYELEDGTVINGYENEYALPLGYTYEQTISSEEYEKLSAIQKQQTLLQCAVVDEEYTTDRKNDLQFNDQKAEYTIAVLDGVVVEGETIVVEKKNAKLLLTADQLEEGEWYLSFKNLYFENVNPIDKFTEEEWNNLSWLKQLYYKVKYKNWEGKDLVKLNVSTDNISKTMRLATEEYAWYSGLHDFTVNLGYNAEDTVEIEITFEDKGIYALQDIELTTQSMDNYPSQIENLKEDTLQDVTIGTNTVTGNIQLDQSKILCLSIPYSEGWTLYVNGEKADLLQINTMYMGALLQEGTSEIELKYTTPGLKTGAVLSLAGILLFAAIIIYEKKKVKQ